MASALIFGAGGQLGRELCRVPWPAGFEPVGLNHWSLDICDAAAVYDIISELRPAVVINAAAYTAVDRAETERDAAFAVNARGPANLAEACSKHAVPLVHVSTDYVFDGTKSSPYVETDETAPLGVYGQSKRDGEIAVARALDRHLILRTSWVYAAHGRNFLKTMLNRANSGQDVRVVGDQIGAPTSAADLARTIVELVPAAVSGDATYGTYHAANGGHTSWYGFARQIFDYVERRAVRSVRLHAITSDEYPTPAARPKNSRLDCTLLARRFAVRMRPWQEAMRDVLDELQASEAVI